MKPYHATTQNYTTPHHATTPNYTHNIMLLHQITPHHTMYGEADNVCARFKAVHTEIEIYQFICSELFHVSNSLIISSQFHGRG